MMLHTTHLIMVLIGLEVFSLSLYVLTGLTRMRLRSVESALKYFLLGAFSSGFMVYGMALLYGAAGTLDMGGIGSAALGQPSNPLLWAGMALVLIGLAFKVAVVPFHQWVPDVYTGAPTPEQAQQAHAYIRSVLAENYGEDTAAKIRIQYGGSVKPNNAAELISQPDVDGFLVGGASLEAVSFHEIVKAASEVADQEAKEDS